tara:strand:- start:238 stop:759 length:522 start_codon:yes stop_codon:yes gene_type:complete
MKLKIVFILLSSLIFPSEIVKHDFYVSITSIRHNLEKENLFIRIKLFASDIEQSFLHEKENVLGIRENSKNEKVKKNLEKYIFSKFSIKINGKPIDISLVKLVFETSERIEDDLFICEFEAFDISNINSIKVSNSILTERFDSQTNIVFIIANGKRETLNLDRRISHGEITYD